MESLRKLRSKKFLCIIAVICMINMSKGFPQPPNRFLLNHEKINPEKFEQKYIGNIYIEKEPEVELEDGLLNERNNFGNMLGSNLERRYRIEDQVFLDEAMNQKRSGNPVRRSWGAGGLPFNVLYMTNAMKPVSTRSDPNCPQPVSSKEELPKVEMPPPRVGELIAYKQSQPKSKLNPPRRYLTLPQLFLSYGWGFGSRSS